MPKLAGMSDAQSPVVEYPGDSATAQQLLELADQYFNAALTTRAKQVKPRQRLTWAPTRLLYVHAIELYLNAWLRKKNVANATLRGMKHSLSERYNEAARLGLTLPDSAQRNLVQVEHENAYVVVRYGPERLRELSNPMQLEGSLIAVRKAVLSAFTVPAP
jgi:hypothetical protein